MRVVDRRRSWLEHVLDTGASRNAVHLAALLQSVIGRPESVASIVKLMHSSPVVVKRTFAELAKLGIVAKEKGEIAIRDSALFSYPDQTSLSDQLIFDASLPLVDLLEEKIGEGDLKSESYSELSDDLSVSKEDPKLPKEELKTRARKSKERAMLEGEYSFAVLHDVYVEAYGLPEGDQRKALVNAPVTGNLGKAACHHFTQPLVCQAIRYSPGDEWISKRFLAAGEVPPLSVLLSPRVIAGLVQKVSR